MPNAPDRPLSPHLQIYRPDVTMVMSIAHRITGIALYTGAAVLALWLAAAALGPDSFALAQRIAGSWFGLIVLVGYSWALMHHLLGGVRHALWDFGILMGPRARMALAQGTWIGALALTALFWLMVWLVRRDAA
jgi:succinate dehydrogenase / fumarate reductase cytochrome b subunit